MGKRGVAAEVTAVTTAVDKALRRVSCGPLLLRASTLYCCDASTIRRNLIIMSKTTML